MRHLDPRVEFERLRNDPERERAELLSGHTLQGLIAGMPAFICSLTPPPFYFVEWVKSDARSIQEGTKGIQRLAAAAWDGNRFSRRKAGGTYYVPNELHADLWPWAVYWAVNSIPDSKDDPAGDGSLWITLRFLCLGCCGKKQPSERLLSYSHHHVCGAYTVCEERGGTIGPGFGDPVLGEFLHVKYPLLYPHLAG